MSRPPHHPALLSTESEVNILKTALADVPVGVMIASAPSGEILYVNPAVERLMGQSVHVSRSIADHATWTGYHADGTPYAAEEWPLARALKHGEVVSAEEIQISRDDGSKAVMTVSAAPMFGDAGHVIGAVVLFADGTEQKRMEQALRQSHDQMNSLLDSIHQVFISLDAEWRIRYVNRAGREHVRRHVTASVEAFLGQVIWDVVPQLSGTPTEATLREAMAERRPTTLEVLGVLSQRWFEVSLVPSSEGLTILGRDIHETKMAQTALQEKLLELERFEEAVIGRELRMIELEKENGRLRRALAARTETPLE